MSQYFALSEGAVVVAGDSFLFLLLWELSLEVLVMLEPVSLTRDLDRVFPHCGFKLHTFFVLMQ
jgi:hypothetical protein